MLCRVYGCQQHSTDLEAFVLAASGVVTALNVRVPGDSPCCTHGEGSLGQGVFVNGQPR